MKRGIASFILLLLVAADPAAAGRCIGYPNSRYVWCDDWDNYCVGGSPWPGYPPTPDNRCPTDGSALSDESFFRDHWPMVCQGPGMDSMAPVTQPGSVYNPPFSLVYQGGTNSAQRHEYSLTGPIAARHPGYIAVNGTDGSPLILLYWAWCPAETGCYTNSPMYVELMYGGDHAPTDNVVADCSPFDRGPYPIVCQQLRYNEASVTCPPLSTQIRASLAYGWLAQLDRDPCDLETGRKPTMYSAATFDGLKWYDLEPGTFPGMVGDFSHSDGGAWFTLTIKTSTYGLMLESVHGYSEATVPRQYTGPFDRVGVGTAAGCLLDQDTGACATPSACWNYAENKQDNGWSAVYIDTPVLLDGVYVAEVGACCMPSGDCEDRTQPECEAASGRFQGLDTACSDPDLLCCPYPWADHDVDGDVDQADFGVMQVCYTGAVSGVPPGCECFDRDQNERVDAGDAAAFGVCYTGPHVPYDAVLPPGCSP